MADGKADKAWDQLFRKYNIPQEISANGSYTITASAIKEFREPRLMAKWDSSEALPGPLARNNLNILPVSRSKYVISDFALYEKFPDPVVDRRIKYVPTPLLETINFENLTSESNAINAMTITHILDDFLGTTNPLGNDDRLLETFNGRMGTGCFSFKVKRSNGELLPVKVVNAQMEIDGGFENNDSIVIMEAKNVPHPDFHVRQLYFPYRFWYGKVHKRIRLVFSQYIDSTYHLFEYTFQRPEDYSSIRFLRSADYSFQSAAVNWDDLLQIWQEVQPVTDDDQNGTNIPFPQADSFPRLIALLEWLAGLDHPASTAETASYMEFDIRQSSYYAAAGEYLGLLDRGHSKIILSACGLQIMRMHARERRLNLVKRVLRHQIFHDFFKAIFDTGALPSRDDICQKMLQYNVCADGSTVRRRASTVLGWLRWIAELPSDDEDQ